MNMRWSSNQTEPAEMKYQLEVQVREKTLLPDICGLQVSEPVNPTHEKVH